MGKVPITLSIFLIFLLHQNCFAQETFKVSDPTVEIDGSMLLITYDLLHSDTTDTFEVRLEVSDDNGNSILPVSVEGDIGDSINGGLQKQITWNLLEDSLFMDGDILINVVARQLLPPEPEVAEIIADSAIIEEAVDLSGQKEDSVIVADLPGVKEDDPAITQVMEPERSPENEIKSFNRGGIIIQSLVVPGLGLSRTKGKPHWLKAVAGYGCLAGSVFLNKKAVNAYESFMVAPNISDARNLANQAIKQDNISEALAYTAIAVWVSDILWTVIGTSELNKSSGAGWTGISLGTVVDQLSQRPLITLTYRF